MKLVSKLWKLLENKVETREELMDAFEEESEELADNFEKNKDKFEEEDVRVDYGGSTFSMEGINQGATTRNLKNILVQQARKIATHFNLEFADSFEKASKIAEEGYDVVYFSETNNGDNFEYKIKMANSSTGFKNQGPIKRKGDKPEKDDKNKENNKDKE
jgi:hypothetical protein